MNRDLLFSDFPELRALDMKGPGKLEEWVEQEFSFVSKSQCESSGGFYSIPDVNDSLGDTKLGLRQPDMGRSCVLGADVLGSERAFELKGCGVRDEATPDDSLHGNGFQNVLPALNDYLYSALLNRITSSSPHDLSWRPIKVYALMLYDFPCTESRRIMPCALQVREPTPRNEMNCWPLPDSEEAAVSFEIESFLRAHGVGCIHSPPFELSDGVITDARSRTIHTSHHQHTSVDLAIRDLCEEESLAYPFMAGIINIQLFRDRKRDKYVLVDMEHFRPTTLLDDLPVMLPCGDRPLGIGTIRRSLQAEPVGPGGNLRSYLDPFASIVSEVDIFTRFAWGDRNGQQRGIYQYWRDVLGLIEEAENDIGLQCHSLGRYLEGILGKCQIEIDREFGLVEGRKGSLPATADTPIIHDDSGCAGRI